MNNRRLCFFNTTQAWGGGEKWHFEMAVHFSRKADRVILIAGKQSELYNRLEGQKNIKLIGVDAGKFSFLNPLKIFELTRIFKEERIDTVIMNLSSDMKLAGIAAMNAAVKHIIYRRGSAIPIKNHLINRLLFKNVITHIIANSEKTKQTILQNNQKLFPENKIEVIYNGLDIEEYDQRKAEKICTGKENEILIGNAGRLAKQKNQKDLIAIADILKRKNLNFKILIAGEGGLKEDLIRLAQKHKLEDKIIFPGFIENIKSFNESIDIFVLTSFWEGFGYVIAEAMLSAKPVVAYHVSSNPEIISDKESGFLIKDFSINEMADKLEFLINHKNKRTEMGKAGRLRAEKLFDVKRSYRLTEVFLTRINS